MISIGYDRVSGDVHLRQAQFLFRVSYAPQGFLNQPTEFETQLIKLLRSIPAERSVEFNDKIQKRTLGPTL